MAVGRRVQLSTRRLVAAVGTSSSPLPVTIPDAMRPVPSIWATYWQGPSPSVAEAE